MGRKHTEMLGPEPVGAPRRSRRSRTAYDEVGERLRAWLEGAREQQQVLSRTLALGATPALVREQANLGRAIATVSAEQRQREKHEHERATRLPPSEFDALAIEWLCEITRERRDAVLAAVAAREPSSLLG